MLIDALAVLIECGELNGKSDVWGNYGRTNRWPAGWQAVQSTNSQPGNYLDRHTESQTDISTYMQVEAYMGR